MYTMDLLSFILKLQKVTCYIFLDNNTNSNQPGNQLILIEWLKDFNDRATLTESNNLMFD